MTITSDAIGANGQLLQQYTCEGDNISPPLTFSETPVEAKSLALVMQDPDAPTGIFTHWTLYDMSPATLQVPEGAMPLTGKTGVNDFGHSGYGGACPPSGTHHYVFTLYALDAMLSLPKGASKHDVLEGIAAHTLQTAKLVGTYTKGGTTGGH